MTTFTVVFDACVLYPFILRDVLIELAVTDIFRAKWTADIHEEWMNSLSKNMGMPLDTLENLRQAMDENVRDWLVEGYTFLIPAVQHTEIPDKKTPM